MPSTRRHASPRAKCGRCPVWRFDKPGTGGARCIERIRSSTATRRGVAKHALSLANPSNYEHHHTSHTHRTTHRKPLQRGEHDGTYAPALLALLHMRSMGVGILLIWSTAFKALRTSNKPGPSGRSSRGLQHPTCGKETAVNRVRKRNGHFEVRLHERCV